MIQDSTRLGTEKINKLLFSLSFPAFIAMFANGLYNIIDTILIGRGVSALAIGGIAIAFPIQMLYMAFSQMIGIGSASAISRSLGEKNEELANQIATNSYVLMTIISLLLTLATLFFMEPILYIFGATEELMIFAKDYLEIICLGVLFNSLSLVSNAILRAEGNIKIGMISILLGIATSLCVGPFFIFVLDYGIKGAAIGTVSSQFVSCIFCLFFIFRGKLNVRLKMKYIIPNWSITWNLLSVGFSAFARNASTSFVSLIVNGTLRLYGGTFAIMMFGICNRIVSFFFLPIMGVNQGLQPIASYNFGAKKYDRITEVLKYSVIWSTLICVMGWGATMIFPHIIISLFTDEVELIESSALLLRFKLLLFPTIGLQMVASTLFQALGKAMPALFLSLLRPFILLAPLVYFLPRFTQLGVLGVWYAFPISDFFGFLITVYFLLRQWRLLKSSAQPLELQRER